VNADALEKLRALGYVAYRSPVSPESIGRRPGRSKSKLWEFNAILDAGDLFTRWHFSGGEALLAQVAEKTLGSTSSPSCWEKLQLGSRNGRKPQRRFRSACN